MKIWMKPRKNNTPFNKKYFKPQYTIVAFFVAKTKVI